MEKKRTLYDRMADFESDELPLEETIDLFQELLDKGLCWQLQGFYGRTAKALLDAGLITRKKENEIK